MNQPLISIIFPTYNGWKDTRDCLSSIENLNYPKQKLEVIVVDNASSDNTVISVRQLAGYPTSSRNFGTSLGASELRVKLIENSQNVGFSKAINLGIKKSRADLVLITNNDVVFDKNYLTNLVDFLHQNPKTGIVGGKVFYKKPQPKAGRPLAEKNKVAFPGAKFNFYTGLLRPNKFPDKVFSTDWVTGCDMLVKKEVIEKIGLLDEKFFFFFEDLDFCLRAKRAGFQVTYYPKAIAFHGEGVSIDKEKWQKKSEYYYYGKTRVLFKHGTPIQIITSLLFQFLIGLPYQVLILKHQNYPSATKALIKAIRDLNEKQS